MLYCPLNPKFRGQSMTYYERLPTNRDLRTPAQEIGTAAAFLTKPNTWKNFCRIHRLAPTPLLTLSWG